jgi:hypothetical protein
MPNAYTAVTHQSYGERLSSSLIVALMGIILFFAAFPVLFLNEGRSVHRAQALEEGEKIVVPIDMNNVLENNNGKLVHLSGRTTTDEVLTDIEFGVEIASVIKLRRVVEMYQWEESVNSETEGHWGGDTTTTAKSKYSHIWSANLIDSDKFPEGHRNLKEMKISGETFTAQQVTLGEFNLSNTLIGRINKYRDLQLDENMQRQVLEKLSTYEGKTDFSAPYFYVVKNPKDHQIGDLRIKFEVVQPTTISVVAEQQVGARLTTYMTQVDEPLELFAYGKVIAEEMFKRAKEANVMKTWFIRLGGFFMMFIGILMVLSVLTILASIIPFLGKFVGVLSAIASFFIAAIFSLITIGIAWVFYRPLLSVILFVIASIFLYLLKFMRKKPQQIVTPEMGIIPQQPMGMVPQQLAGMVPQQAVIAQPMLAPQQQAVAPQPPMGVIPQQQVVVPQQAVIAQPMLVPQQQAVAPQPLMGVIPQQQAVVPQQVVMVPQQQAVAPQQMMMVPQQQAVAPQQVVMVPQQQTVAPQPALFQTLGNNSLMQQNEGTGLAFETVVPQKV